MLNSLENRLRESVIPRARQLAEETANSWRSFSLSTLWTQESEYKQTNRRKSVFAEKYDPEMDENDKKVVYPKSYEQRQLLMSAVKDVFILRYLDKEQLMEVLDAMQWREVADKEEVITKDEDGDFFYIVHSGSLEAKVEAEGEAMTEYRGEGSFGELALLYNTPRTATVTATSPCALWALDRETFRRIVLHSAFRKRKKFEELLASVPFLATLTDYERMNIGDALVSEEFIAGAQIIRQGDPAQGMFIIEEGRVRVSVFNKATNQHADVGELSHGQYFGELALVTKEPRYATVSAVTKVKLAFLDVAAFERLLGPCLELMKRNIPFYEEQRAKLFGANNVEQIESTTESASVQPADSVPAQQAQP